MSMIAEAGAHLGHGTQREEAARLVQEIHRMLRDSVQPYRAPTSTQLRERAAAVVGLVPELFAEGLTEKEVEGLLKVVLSRVLEAHFSERIADTLAQSPSGRPPREGRDFGRFTHFALSNG